MEWPVVARSTQEFISGAIPDPALPIQDHASISCARDQIRAGLNAARQPLDRRQPTKNQSRHRGRSPSHWSVILAENATVGQSRSNPAA
jgi:hypothetical protein